MGNLIYQSETSIRLQYVIWGGQFSSNLVTFFHSVKRVGIFYSFYLVENIDILTRYDNLEEYKR